MNKKTFACFSLRSACLLLFFSLMAFIPARADTVTFNNLVDRTTPTYTENGITVTTRTHDSTRNVLRGTDALQIDEFGYFPYEFTYANGAFNAVGFDLTSLRGGCTFYGYVGDTLQATLNLTDYPEPRPGQVIVHPGQFVVFGSGFENITRLVWSFNPQDNAFWYEMDNFTFHPANTAAVPEPASLLLLATGLTGIVSLVRRKKIKPDSPPSTEP
jgi:hypothetical protein